jgi:serine/threonine protein kinase
VESSVDTLGDPGSSRERIGSLVLIAPLGSGGMGEVWRARDEVLRREVAVKLLRPGRVDNAEARARMLREARAQATVSHANVCTIYQAGEGPEGVWIAMELLPGPTLVDRVRAGGLPSGEVARLGAQMAAGLAAAHARALVHRDVKPANAMLDADGAVKLLDFGLVKELEPALSADGKSALTSDGAVIGSPGYMSPEQVRGAAVTAATDVFSLGAVLYELASGIRGRRAARRGANQAVSP